MLTHCNPIVDHDHFFFFAISPVSLSLVLLLATVCRCRHEGPDMHRTKQPKQKKWSLAKNPPKPRVHVVVLGVGFSFNCFDFSFSFVPLICLPVDQRKPRHLCLSFVLVIFFNRDIGICLSVVLLLFFCFKERKKRKPLHISEIHPNCISDLLAVVYSLQRSSATLRPMQALTVWTTQGGSWFPLSNGPSHPLVSD